jgi:hypothetical protein
MTLRARGRLWILKRGVEVVNGGKQGSIGRKSLSCRTFSALPRGKGPNIAVHFASLGPACSLPMLSGALLLNVFIQVRELNEFSGCTDRRLLRLPFWQAVVTKFHASAGKIIHPTNEPGHRPLWPPRPPCLASTKLNDLS